MNAEGRLALEGELTIYRVNELKDALVAALADHPALELDLSKVGELDGAGLQLLLFAKRSAEAAGGALRVSAPSPAVSEVLGLLKLESAFGLGPASAASDIAPPRSAGAMPPRETP